MIAGRLTELVTLQRPTVSTDAFGAESTTFADSATVHAEVVWKTGNTGMQVGELFPSGHVEIIIRDAHEVSEKWRAVYDGTVYSVSALEHNRQRGLKRLICDKVNE
ncbi:MAG: phage head closure protein [Bacteroidales bacterium]|nr:phage head closure protein [Bacteroidales bacterium]